MILEIKLTEEAGEFWERRATEDNSTVTRLATSMLEDFAKYSVLATNTIGRQYADMAKERAEEAYRAEQAYREKWIHGLDKTEVELARERSEQPPADDPINPNHYKSHPSGVECIEITRHMTFNAGNVFKYLWRAGLKGGTPKLQDFKKALWYLLDEIKLQEKAESSDKHAG